MKRGGRFFKRHPMDIPYTGQKGFVSLRHRFRVFIININLLMSPLTSDRSLQRHKCTITVPQRKRK